QRNTRGGTNGNVVAAGGITERLLPGGGVVGAGHVGEERIEPAGGVLAAGGVVQERQGPAGGVAVAAGVGDKRSGPDRRIVQPDDDVRQRDIRCGDSVRYDSSYEGRRSGDSHALTRCAIRIDEADG